MRSMRSMTRKVGSSILGFLEAAMTDCNSPEIVAARDEFHRVFGRTLTAWAGVEEALFEWFKACTGLHERLARAVFYSVRSFAGQWDMLIASVPFSPFDEQTQTSIRQ